MAKRERMNALAIVRPHLFYDCTGRCWVCCQAVRLTGYGFSWRDCWDNFKQVNGLTVHHLTP